jgi:hypothetical protein
MSRLVRTNTFIALTLCLVPAIHGSDKGGTSLREKANRMFSLGQVRVYEIATPEWGFIGSPFDLSGIPRGMRPTKEEHFRKRFLRVKIAQKRQKGDDLRIVFRLDEMDNKGAVIKEALYFAYLDVCPQGARVLCKNQDDGRDYAYLGTNYDLPFPFTCTRPPALGFLKGTQDGYLDSMGRGVVYTREAPKSSSFLLEVRATRFNKHRGAEQLVRWCGSEAAELAKEDAETRVLFHETQKWERADDWLWVEMERTDKDGNILMRCKMVEPETFPPGSSVGSRLDASHGA